MVREEGSCSNLMLLSLCNHNFQKLPRTHVYIINQHTQQARKLGAQAAMTSIEQAKPPKGGWLWKVLGRSEAAAAAAESRVSELRVAAGLTT